VSKYKPKVQKGLFKEIARERGVSSFKVRAEFMRNVAEAARRYIESRGLDPVMHWMPTISKMLEIGYRLMAELKRVPTADEVLEAYKKGGRLEHQPQPTGK